MKHRLDFKANMLTYRTGPLAWLTLRSTGRLIECEQCGQNLSCIVDSVPGFERKTAIDILAAFPEAAKALRPFLLPRDRFS